ncbi:MAG: hypothetical protein ACJ73S_07930 [Mycobacteriales bacterium]
MAADRRRFGEMGTPELLGLLRSRTLASSIFGGNEWLSVVGEVTFRVQFELPAVSYDEQIRYVEVMDLLLEQAQQSGGLPSRECVLRRLNMTSYFLALIEINKSYRLLDPEFAAMLFIREVPISWKEAVAVCAHWRDCDAAEIRRLRDLKNLLIPMRELRQKLKAETLRDEIDRWCSLIPCLP